MAYVCRLSSSERFFKKVLCAGIGSFCISTAHLVFHRQNLKIAVSSKETSFCGSKKKDSSGVSGHKIAARLARSLVYGQ